MGSAIHRVGSSGLLSIMAVVVALALVAVVLLTRGTVPSASVGDPGIATADLPPVGEIRFGAGFDSTTFALSGASHEVRVGSTIAAVAHLSRPVGSNQAEVRIQLDGSVIAANPLLLAGMSQRDVAGWTFATPVAGEYAVSVIDQDGSTLATGRFTAR